MLSAIREFLMRNTYIRRPKSVYPNDSIKIRREIRVCVHFAYFTSYNAQHFDRY